MYVIDDEIGSKRKISTLNKWLKAKDIDVDDLWGKIDGIIIKTVLAAYPILKHSYHACFPMHDKTYACFELLGFDILLDWRLKPYLLELKAKEEERKRIVRKWSEPKLGSESSNASKKFQEKSKSAGVLRKNINKQDAQGSPINALYSFEPEIISESEERERVTALAQRDFLIKSYGMLEQIYMAMKKNGTLRPADERKYGLYGRLGLHANTDHSTCSSAHKLHHRQNDCTHAAQLATDQCIKCSLKGNNVIIFL
ncbi:tubulin polyglutamylase ttll6 [Lasius niger]|uniref:Tubulin polyglutamylase ttll6 n=1 Tax=Lasius niger TaxID=67767 RepID=A0A0J7KVU0_LASNI|nr:tubulin polyglutamylase ttll6 [Lasius niger]